MSAIPYRAAFFTEHTLLRDQPPLQSHTLQGHLLFRVYTLLQGQPSLQSHTLQGHLLYRVYTLLQGQPPLAEPHRTGQPSLRCIPFYRVSHPLQSHTFRSSLLYSAYPSTGSAFPYRATPYRAAFFTEHTLTQGQPRLAEPHFTGQPSLQRILFYRVSRPLQSHTLQGSLLYSAYPSTRSVTPCRVTLYMFTFFTAPTPLQTIPPDYFRATRPLRNPFTGPPPFTRPKSSFYGATVTEPLPF